LNARIADDETFHRYHLERPAFLSGTTVAVGRMARASGSDPALERTFTEPLVTSWLTYIRGWPDDSGIHRFTGSPDLASKPSSEEATPATSAAEAQAPAAAGNAATAGAPTARDAQINGPHVHRRASRHIGPDRKNRRRPLPVRTPQDDDRDLSCQSSAFQANLNRLHSGR